MLLKARRFLDLAAWTLLVRTLSRSGSDIVQTNMAELSLPVRLLALFLPKLHVVHTVQNPVSSEPWYWRVLNLLTLSLCDRIVFCSESLRAESGISGGKILAVQNGIEIESPALDLKNLREKFGLGQEEKVVCCVARLTRQKGQDILIRAIAQLAAQKKNIRLLLAGDGEDADSLIILSKELGVERLVHFLGRRFDIPEILSISDVYAAPSRWEGLGISLGEAMLAGIPCVGTKIAGHVDILKDGITGLAVTPGDPSAMAAGIMRLLDNPGEARSMAQIAREFIKAGFTIRSMAEKYEKIYLDLVGGGRNEQS